MSQVLSQTEVDALLDAVVGGEVDVGNKSGTKEDTSIVTYDLTSQDKVIRGRMPTLDIIYERFIRAYRMTLSSQLRKLATLSIASTDTMKLGFHKVGRVALNGFAGFAEIRMRTELL
jgi:flagellar motor switch protein FliM